MSLQDVVFDVITRCNYTNFIIMWNEWGKHSDHIKHSAEELSDALIVLARQRKIRFTSSPPATVADWEVLQ